jgi:hypothetical protein
VSGVAAGSPVGALGTEAVDGIEVMPGFSPMRGVALPATQAVALR